MANKCTSFTSRFDGHGGGPEQYRRHRPMRHVQGYSGSHWMLALGDYSLRITPAAARATGIQTIMNTPAKLAILMAMAMHPYVTAHIAWWRRSRALLEATGRHHRASIMPDNIVRTWLQWFFYVFIVTTVGKGHGLTIWTLFLIGIWPIKQKRRA